MQREVSATHSAVASQLSQFSSGAWTSSGLVDDLTPQLLEAVSASFKDLDPLIRVRFLVACCLAPPDKKQALMPGLRNVLQLAQQDDDEWVQALGYSIDPEHASIRLDEQSLQCGRNEIKESVRELVEALDTVTVSNRSPLVPTVDTFNSKNQATSVTPPTVHTHFTVRENYHDIEAVLLEGRPGDVCLPSIISRAAEGSGYAALFSGQHTVTAAPQFRQNKVASASMFAKSTASHPKPHSAGPRHVSTTLQGHSQHPNKRTKLTAAVPGQLPALQALKATPAAAPAGTVEMHGRISSPTVAPSDAAAAPASSSSPAPPGTSAAEPGRPPANVALPSHTLPDSGSSPQPGIACANQGRLDTSLGNPAAQPNTDTAVAVDEGASRAYAGAFRMPQAAAVVESSTTAAAGAGVGQDVQAAVPEIGLSLLQASDASSDLPAVLLERAGSSRHGEG